MENLKLLKNPAVALLVSVFILFLGIVLWMNLTPGNFQYGVCGYVGYYTSEEVENMRNWRTRCRLPPDFEMLKAQVLIRLANLDFNRGPVRSPSAQAEVKIDPPFEKTFTVSEGQVLIISSPGIGAQDWHISYDPASLLALTPQDKMASPGQGGWKFKAIRLGAAHVNFETTCLGGPSSPCAHFTTDVNLNIQPTLAPQGFITPNVQSPFEQIDEFIRSLFGRLLPSRQDNKPEFPEEGKFCGGIAANSPENQCPSGYRCQLDGNYPDAGGHCIKQGLFGF